MRWLERIIQLEVWLIVLALAFAALAKIFSRRGGFHMTGLLCVKRPSLHGQPHSHETSPARIQLFVFVMAGTFLLLIRVFTGATDTLEFPQEFLLVYGGSSTAYLGFKARHFHGGSQGEK